MIGIAVERPHMSVIKIPVQMHILYPEKNSNGIPSNYSAAHKPIYYLTDSAENWTM